MNVVLLTVLLTVCVGTNAATKCYRCHWERRGAGGSDQRCIKPKADTLTPVDCQYWDRCGVTSAYQDGDLVILERTCGTTQNENKCRESTSESGLHTITCGCGSENCNDENIGNGVVVHRSTIVLVPFLIVICSLHR